MKKKSPRERADESLHEYFDAPIGLCYFDRDFRYEYINKWLADINGFSPEEHLGKTIHEIVPDIAAKVISQLRHVLETGEPIIDGEAEATTPATNSDRKFFRHSYHAALDFDGKIVGVSCVVQDITELRSDDDTMHDSLGTLQSVHERLERVLLLLDPSPGGL